MWHPFIGWVHLLLRVKLPGNQQGDSRKSLQEYKQANFPKCQSISSRWRKDCGHSSMVKCQRWLSVRWLEHWPPLKKSNAYSSHSPPSSFYYTAWTIDHMTSHCVLLGNEHTLPMLNMNINYSRVELYGLSFGMCRSYQAHEYEPLKAEHSFITTIRY